MDEKRLRLLVVAQISNLSGSAVPLKDDKCGKGLKARFGVWLKQLARPQLTIAAFIAVAIGAWAVSRGFGAATLMMTPPLVVLLLNLSASLLTHVRFRRDMPLLVFHLSLIALILLLGLARMNYLDGQLVLTRNVPYSGQMVSSEQGPWYRPSSSIKFVHEGFVDIYPADGDEYQTFNRVRWWDEQGISHVGEIGDDRPLLLDGYRLYASRRGYAPRMIWDSVRGNSHFIDIQLGSIERDGWYEGSRWVLDDGPEIWVSMQRLVEQPLAGHERLNMGVADIKDPVVVRIDDRRVELAPGESLRLSSGSLTYASLDVWMGYRIVYDPTMPWIIATLVIAVLSLLSFYIRNLFWYRESES